MVELNAVAHVGPQEIKADSTSIANAARCLKIILCEQHDNPNNQDERYNNILLRKDNLKANSS